MKFSVICCYDHRFLADTLNIFSSPGRSCFNPVTRREDCQNEDFSRFYRKFQPLESLLIFDLPQAGTKVFMVCADPISGKVTLLKSSWSVPDQSVPLRGGNRYAALVSLGVILIFRLLQQPQYSPM